MNGKELNVQLEIFESSAHVYTMPHLILKDADFVILVYSIDNMRTFNSIEEWN